MGSRGIVMAAVLTALVAAAPVSARQAPNALEQAYQRALTAAEDAWSRAASAGGEWRDTREVLLAAVEAAQQGDFNRAIELADRARRQGEMRYSSIVAEQQNR